MASSSQRVYTSCSLFLSLSLRIQFNFSLISRLDSLCLSFVATILSDVFVSGFWQPRGDLGELYREYNMCAKTKHLCLKTVRKYRNAKTLYKHMYVVRRISLERASCCVRLFMLYVHNSTCQIDINILQVYMDVL